MASLRTLLSLLLVVFAAFYSPITRAKKSKEPEIPLSKQEKKLKKIREAELAEAKHFVFAHVGKGGGSTVGMHLKTWNSTWELMKRCHPVPCLRFSDKLFKQKKGVLVNVRDPAERFRSAFDWRHKKLGLAVRKNKDIPKKERDVWQIVSGTGRYTNANDMAEKLCARGTEAEHQQAAVDVHNLRHAKAPLIAHLGGSERFFNIVNGVEKYDFTYFVAPLEPGFDFEPLIDSAIEALLLQEYDGDQAFVDSLKPPSSAYDLDTKHAKKLAHTSVDQQGWHTVPLSKAGQCCLVRYYRDDYLALPMLASMGCRGVLQDECRAALMSMYNRRTDYINATAQHCAALL